ncbi:MAG TPA: saccharopine dehydrogenase C-terminal domain-containing protein [Bacteroidota bacterium]
MKFLVIGSGMMGSAIAYDLSQSDNVAEVTLADIDRHRAEEAAKKIGHSMIKTTALDVNVHDDVVQAMRGNAVAIGAVSYRNNVALTKAAIEAGVNYCDLGGNDDVVEEQLSLDAVARERRVTIVPNCGLAPGLANILAARGTESFDTIDRVTMRVGGLPQHPVPPFNYQIVFSVEGLLNEYSGKSKVIREHKLTTVDTLTEIESIEFPPPFGRLEAFHTSGGASFTPKLFAGRVRELDYKTIRYPGHCEKIRTLLDLGFGSNEPLTLGSNVLTERELFIELLKRKLPQSGHDVVLLRVIVEGIVKGERRRRTFSMIDFYDETRNISAMMRGTAYPTSVIAQFIASGIIKQAGAVTPEECVPLEPLLSGLKKRGITIQQEWN